MIDKPIVLKLRLTYGQARAIVQQLTPQLEEQFDKGLARKINGDKHEQQNKI